MERVSLFVIITAVGYHLKTLDCSHRCYDITHHNVAPFHALNDLAVLANQIFRLFAPPFSHHYIFDALQTHLHNTGYKVQRI